MSTPRVNLPNEITTNGQLDIVKLRQAGAQATGNAYVDIQEWRVSYQEARLAASCTAVSKAPAEGIYLLMVDATSPNSSVVYCQTITTVEPDKAYDDPLQVAAWTGLFSPNVQGNTVSCIIYGYVHLGGNTGDSFFFEKNFQI